jgi:putative phosphoesterase
MIGIMSDSHDNLDAVRKAVRFFNKMDCDLVLHAGDFIAPFAAKELGHLSCQVRAVFGNCDGEKEGLTKAFQSFGAIKNAPFVFDWKNLTILLTHTQFSNKKYVNEAKYDVIFFGHTHRPIIEKKGNTLLLNPGETGGWVTGKSSLALFDPKTREAEIVFI